MTGQDIARSIGWSASRESSVIGPLFSVISFGSLGAVLDFGYSTGVPVPNYGTRG